MISCTRLWAIGGGHGHVVTIKGEELQSQGKTPIRFGRTDLRRGSLKDPSGQKSVSPSGQFLMSLDTTCQSRRHRSTQGMEPWMSTLWPDLFWDVPLDSVDPVKNQRWLIERVLGACRGEDRLLLRDHLPRKGVI